MPPRKQRSLEEIAAEKPVAKRRAAAKKATAKKSTVKRARGAVRPRAERNAKHPTIAETIKRNLEIVYDREILHMGWSAVAKKHDVTEKTAREGFKMHVKEIAPLMESEDALDKAYEYVRKLEGIQQRFAEIANGAKATDGVKLQALREIVNTMQREIELRQAVGMLPRDLHDLNEIADGRFVAENLARLLERIDAPQEAFEELAAIMESVARRRIHSEEE